MYLIDFSFLDVLVFISMGPSDFPLKEVITKVKCLEI